MSSAWLCCLAVGGALLTTRQELTAHWHQPMALMAWGRELGFAPGG